MSPELEEAYHLLTELLATHPADRLRDTAMEVQHALFPVYGAGPDVKLPKPPSKRQVDKAVTEFADAADEAIKSKKSHAYKTKVFKCLADYEACAERRDHKICAALAVICIAQQLIPFAPR